MRAFGHRGRGAQGFGADWLAVAFNKDACVLVADRDNHRVLVFREDGTLVRRWGSRGSEEGQFRQPAGISVSPLTGEVFVTDKGNHRVQVFTPEGRFVRAWGGYGVDAGRLQSPLGVAVSLSDRVFVADLGNKRVQVFRGDGAYEGTVGRAFVSPCSVAVGSGTLAVADRGDDCVHLFEAESLAPLQVLGARRSGQFRRPCGVAITPFGELCVTDDASRCQVFRLGGGGAQVCGVRSFGAWGSGRGEWYGSALCAADDNGSIAVGDFSNARVQLFE